MILQDTQRGFLEWWLGKHEDYPDFVQTVDIVNEILSADGYYVSEQNILNNLLKKYQNQYLAYANLKVAIKNMKMVEPPRSYQGEIIALGKGLEKFEARIYDINRKQRLFSKRFQTWEEADNWIDINTI